MSTGNEPAGQAGQRAQQFAKSTFDHLNTGAFWVDRQGRFVEVNAAASRLLGYTRAELLQMTVHEVDLEFPAADLDRRWNEIQARGSVLFEARHRTKDGHVVDVEVHAHYLCLDGAEFICGLVRDIAASKKVEDALRLSQDRFRLMIESIPMLAWQCNAKGEAEYCNHRWYDYTGAGPEKTLGDMWQKALHPDDEQRIARETVRTAQTSDPYDVEYRLRRHDGQYRWHLARALPVRDATGKVIMWVGCAADVEDQKRAEAALRQSAADLERQVQDRTATLQRLANDLRREVTQRNRVELQLLEISEREQRRIGQELHDSLGQLLAAVRFLSANLHHQLAATKHHTTPMAMRVHDELGTAIEQLRSVARGLHPVRQEPEGLTAALTELAHSTAKLFRIPCRFHCPAPVLLTDETAAAHLYRIAQEAVANAVKHARARQIVIELKHTGKTLSLHVHDDGCGLPARARRTAGLGLSIMKYRAKVIGATLSIRSVAKRGTVITCRWTPTPDRPRGRSRPR
ncbi:MAG: hypothetical protein PCFJNLEI_02862 [Verrucomicrobiae bacterium]|nr:hypothetical protein [Verrucomicrobiae bacterium]